MFPKSQAQRVPRGLQCPTALTLVGLAVFSVAQPAFAADEPSPGLEAIDTFRAEKRAKNAVENRFFTKSERFEISPVVGYVPNNPFAVRYTGGAILGYHFTETISAQSQIAYSPDMGENDLKGLVSVLLDRANAASSCSPSATGGGSTNCVEFQQPLDKVTLSAAFGIAWAPVYGKINLVGETVLNFDLYGFVGAGMLAKTNFNAQYDADGVETGDVVNLALATKPNDVLVAPVIGVGQNYFLNQMMSFKIDARVAFYVDDKPQYSAAEEVTEKQLYNNFIISGGVGFFFPKMKPRLYDF